VKQGDYSSWNVLFENRMNRSGQPASVSGASAARAEVRYQVRIESEAAISKQAALQKSLSRESENDEEAKANGILLDCRPTSYLGNAMRRSRLVVSPTRLSTL
jgi:hypothetical protein